jgi:NADPH:quinone reductase-like Zn-dependent oxidoreductase
MTAVIRGAAAAETMTAIVHDAYGTVPEDVLRVAEVDKPTTGDDEVLVGVHAASIDQGTWHIMADLPYPIRVAGFGLRKRKYPNPGRSLAGTVEAVGNDVTGFSQGDEVYGVCDGSFAQYVRVRTGKLAPKPVNLSLEDAAAVPVSALTALQGVRDHGRVQAGEKVLIVGASGGVGTFAVQIEKAFGAEVTGVCSTSKVDTVRSIGADHIVDYTLEDFAGGGQRFDVILDIGGHRSLKQLRRALTPGGRSSSSEQRRAAGGSEVTTGRSGTGRSPCPRSPARSPARSSAQRMQKTLPSSPSSSSPAR